MAERLKDQYLTPESIEAMADAVSACSSEFSKERFLEVLADQGMEDLELKERMHRIAAVLGETLPDDYREALDILRAAAPSIHGFEVMALPDYVEMFGMDDWEASLDALEYFTRYGSSEFAIRPFLNADPARVLPRVKQWARDPNEHVRRLASEGCRPRLPWAMNLPRFMADPEPVLPILELLKDDPSETVRRSVANHLNDISKDNPETALSIAESWAGHSEEVDRLVKHACRTLLKAGHPRAMRLIGFADPDAIEVENLTVEQMVVPIGSDLRFMFELVVGGNQAAKLRLEYAITYAKARGKSGKKVFGWSEKVWEPGVFQLSKRHSMADMSTRKHYSGGHTVAVVVNGIEKASSDFLLR